MTTTPAHDAERERLEAEQEEAEAMLADTKPHKPVDWPLAPDSTPPNFTPSPDIPETPKVPGGWRRPPERRGR